MDRIREFLDERVRLQLWGRCAFCGRKFSDGKGRTRDHVPAKTLLREPFPTDICTVQVCCECNNRLSDDERYVRVLIGCVLSGSADPQDQEDPLVRKTLEQDSGLRERLAQARVSPQGGLGDTPLWQPESDRIARVLVKNARGHLWYECGLNRFDEPATSFLAFETLSDGQRAAYEARGDSEEECLLPEVGSRLLERSVASDDVVNGWVVVQDGVYRFAVVQRRDGGIKVLSVLAEYLATAVVWPPADQVGQSFVTQT